MGASMIRTNNQKENETMLKIKMKKLKVEQHVDDVDDLDLSTIKRIF
jgi:hypothetical protein